MFNSVTASQSIVCVHERHLEFVAVFLACVIQTDSWIVEKYLRCVVAHEMLRVRSITMLPHVICACRPHVCGRMRDDSDQTMDWIGLDRISCWMCSVSFERHLFKCCAVGLYHCWTIV